MKNIVACLLLFTLAFHSVRGGSVCPPREDIYPCTCFNIPFRNLLTTIVSCFRLRSSKDFAGSISDSLKKMEIEKFYLHDSFWASDNEERNLPDDWISMFKITEYHIEDTILSPTFACAVTRSPTANIYTKRFNAINSSSSADLSVCKNPNGGLFSWTALFKDLEYFQFSHGKLSTLNQSLFLFPMQSLKVLNLTKNRINSIHPEALLKVSTLKSLDLSHNTLQNINNILKSNLKNLTLLNLGWNMITTIEAEVFPSLPKLVWLILNNNMLVHLSEKQWKMPPAALRMLDIRGNPIDCSDCGITWMNTTFPKQVRLLGHCKTPAKYKQQTLRYKSNYFARNCDANGKLTTKASLHIPTTRSLDVFEGKIETSKFVTT